MNITRIKSKLRYILWQIKRISATLLFKDCEVKRNKIVFDNFIGKGFGDNPKYIAEELLKCNKDYDLIWVLRDTSEQLPAGIRPVKYGSLSSLYEYATARIWVDNVRNNLHPKKKKGQIYLQTWHGGYSLKPVEGQIADKLSPEYVKQAKIDGVEVDAIIPSCKAQENLFKEYFWLRSDVEYLRTGLPRNDILFQNEHHEQYRKMTAEEMGVPVDNYVILYVPTFRDDGGTEGYLKEIEAVHCAFERRMKKACTVIIRLHPNAEKLANVYRYNEHIINGTHYPDAQRLCILADCIITDYSSIAMDAAVIKKLVLLYTSDAEAYRNTRGLTSDFDTWPLPKAYSEAEMIDIIESLDNDEYNNLLEKYLSENVVYDTGRAAEAIIDWLEEKC